MSPLQKDADRALVVAVTTRAVFDAAAGDVYGMGVAFPLLQVRIEKNILNSSLRLLRVDNENNIELHQMGALKEPFSFGC